MQRRVGERRGAARQTRGASTWILKMSHNERSASGCRSSVYTERQRECVCVWERETRRERMREEKKESRENQTPFASVAFHVRVLTISRRQLRFLFAASRLRIIITAETVTVRRACISCG